MSRLLSLALVFGALALAPAFAQDGKPAPVSPEPGESTATYGDWILRCQRIGEAGKAVKICEIVQTVQGGQEGHRQPVAQLAFGRLKLTDPWRVTAHLPSNILLPGMVKFALGDNDPQPMELPWRRCIPQGCFADAALGDAQWKALLARGENGSLEFTDGLARPAKLPISFRGFAQAGEALAKEQLTGH
jgi:invasion protein IalB